MGTERVKVSGRKIKSHSYENETLQLKYNHIDMKIKHFS
jgi:hypothetical protein